MAEREPVAWITRGGKHIPIFADEATDDEKKKDREIAESKKQADEKNTGDKEDRLESSKINHGDSLEDKQHSKKNKENAEKVEDGIKEILKDLNHNEDEDIVDEVWERLYDYFPITRPDDQSYLVLDNNRGNFDKNGMIGFVRVDLASKTGEYLQVELFPRYAYMDDFDDEDLATMGIEK